MSKRILVSSLVAVAVVGGVAAGGFAMAASSDTEPTVKKTEPTVENTTVRYVAPSGTAAGSLTFTADTSDDSGIQGLKAVAWPARSKLDPTEAEMLHVDSATCSPTTDATSRCTYTLKVTREEAADLDKGTWYVSVLATAKDGGTAFVPRAATAELTG
ncbi:hypothetical protein HTV45_17550 [Streptomyces sp. CHD11]|uniref:DUF5707 domain-containing protein n=1 Tax=Streptomyces sp. CHD11 TaxID=2741325 RepID=UPI001BFBFCF4|nr:DUF5707 domain-containing protein [Streptomyces sp. CHD11]MBT3152657.1 hypothetical protein [Streptomyces sp. CHD11]